MAAVGVKLVAKYSYPDPKIASRQLENDLQAATKEHEDHKDACNAFAGYLLTTLSKGRALEVVRNSAWCQT